MSDDEPELVRQAREVQASPALYDGLTRQLAEGVIKWWQAAMTFEDEADERGAEVKRFRVETDEETP